jgi:uncharacterized integral membrane protein
LYRIIFIIVVTLAVFVGLLLGTLNSETVTVDLLWLQIRWPLGLLILSSAAAGFLLGLFLAWFFTILPLRVQLRKLRSESSYGPSGTLKNHDA